MKFSTISLHLAIFGLFQSNPAFADDDITIENVRFNKFGVLDSGEAFAQENLPLMADDYPISANPDVFNFLSTDTDAESVVNEASDFEVVYSVPELIEVVGGGPDHPTSDFDAPYWGRLNRVINMRNIRGGRRASRALAREMRLPLRWRDFTVDDVAQAVYDEVSFNFSLDQPSKLLYFI